MEKIKVMMIDDNVSLVEMVKEYFKDNENIEIYKQAHNGLDGIKLIEEEQGKFDVVLLDLIMPQKDGLYVLQQIKERELDANVIVETSYNAQDVIRQVSEYGVSYFILKPFDLEDLKTRIAEVYNSKNKTGKNINLKQNNLQISITKILHELGIPSHIRGYLYIRDSIKLMYMTPDMIGGITKEIYPEIAKKYNATPSRVERAIRHAIEISWNRGDYEVMDRIFGHSVDYDKAKPTNSEFIATIADHIRLESMTYN